MHCLKSYNVSLKSDFMREPTWFGTFVSSHPNLTLFTRVDATLLSGRGVVGRLDEAVPPYSWSFFLPFSFLLRPFPARSLLLRFLRLCTPTDGLEKTRTVLNQRTRANFSDSKKKNAFHKAVTENIEASPTPTLADSRSNSRPQQPQQGAYFPI